MLTGPLVENLLVALKGPRISTIGIAPFLKEMTDWKWRITLEQNCKLIVGERFRIVRLMMIT